MHWLEIIFIYGELVGKYYDLDNGKICNLQTNLNFVKHLEYLLSEYI